MGSSVRLIFLAAAVALTPIAAPAVSQVRTGHTFGPYDCNGAYLLWQILATDKPRHILAGGGAVALLCFARNSGYGKTGLKATQHYQRGSATVVLRQGECVVVQGDVKIQIIECDSASTACGKPPKKAFQGQLCVLR